MIIAQIVLFLCIGLLAGFAGTMLVATAMDWYNYRRNRLIIELQRDHTQRRRPAAK